MKKKQLKAHIAELENDYSNLADIANQQDIYIQQLQDKLRETEIELAATKVTREVWGE